MTILEARAECASHRSSRPNDRLSANQRCLSRFRAHLLGTAASMAALASATTPAAAACTTGTTAGVIIQQCSGTMTGNNSPGISYSSATDPFEIQSTATVSTTGASAYGIYGYGQGPYALVNSSGSIKTLGDSAHGILVLGYNSVAIARFDGTITTSGANAYGIHANAISAGTADAGILSQGAVSTTGITAHGLYAYTVADVSSTMPSSTGLIRIRAESAITTTGNGARGIFADNAQSGQSIGSVTVSSSGSIRTYGDNAEGIHATNGGPGTIAITNTGTIATRGAFSDAIYAFNNSDGSITVSSTGAISTAGESSNGIRAVTFGTGGDISVSANRNITTTGAYAAAIYADANNGNVAINVGPEATLTSRQDSAAIIAYGTAVAISNAGVINGNIHVNTATGSLTNLPNATINSGTGISFGEFSGVAANATLSNSGTISPGGNGTIQTTTLAGNFSQSATGRLVVDTSWQTGASDKLVVTGTATIAGTVIVNPINLGSPLGLTRIFTILTAAGGIIDNGISIANTAAATYVLQRQDANTLGLTGTINFQGSNATALHANQTAVGAALNSAFAKGNALSFMPTLLTVSSASQYATILKHLGPSGDNTAFSGAMQTGNTFAQQLLSCRMAGEHRDANRFIREGQCLWARIGARRLENDGRSDGVGFTENSSLFSAGAQLKVAQDWRVGGGIGYEQASSKTDTKATTEGDRLHLGGVVKYNPGPWLLAATVTGGHGWHDNTRRVAIGNLSSVATSQSETSFLAGRLTAAYLMSRGDWYLKPQIEVASSNLMRGSYTEAGSGGIALHLQRSQANVMSATPSVEIGAEHRHDGAMYRAFVRGGASFRDKDTFVTTATFADAPSGSPFSTATRIDRITADIGAGIDLLLPRGTNVRVQYDGIIGQNTTAHSGSAKVSMPF